MKTVGLIVLLLTFFPQSILAQEYDSDSVYYTRIIKPDMNVSPKKHMAFRDTVNQSSFISYFFQIYSGASIGCSNCDTGWEYTYSLSTIHGITVRRKFRVGGGVAFESYTQWRTLPVFANVSYDLIGSKNTNAVFLQAQYGRAFGWYHQVEQEYGLKDDHGGTYAAAQIGYRIRYHDLRISVLTGFKQQTVSTYYEYPNGILPIPSSTPLAPNTLTRQREMQRFTISLGIGWK